MIKLFYKNCSILRFLCMILTSFFLQAQDKKTIPDIEKVYLHTDRNTYFMGEDLWYKAYNVRASNNLLFDNSKILYVELISSDSKIIARNKTLLEMGLGHGDFALQDSLDVKPGCYQLRAYTNWNRNFGDGFVFKKDIEIIDVFEYQDKSKAPKSITLESKSAKKEVTKQNAFKVYFFPEGGSLLENVSSFIGFKAVDLNEKPIEIKGDLYDSNNELVTSFESVHDGMGKLQMLPLEGKTYYAKIKSPLGEEANIELPTVLKQGYLLSFRTFKSKNIVSIITNEATFKQNPNPVLTVICKAKGEAYLETTQTLIENTLSFELPKDKAPEGISQITLLDNTNKPQSERLIYIEKEHDLDVQLITDKLAYQPNEKVTINVSSKSKEGVAKSASFSMSVTDMNGVEEPDFGTNISSYFLMESDIRGKVYNPGYYFDTSNPKRLEHLDNLLLTQGWRDFVWKTIPKANDTINYIAEKGFTIKGKVKQVFTNKPKVNNRVGLVLLNKKHINTFKTTTDTNGNFKFENINFSDKTDMHLNSRDQQGKFRGEIVLDSVEHAPMVVSFKNEPINRSESTRIMVDKIFNKYTAFGVKPENVLNEILIKSKKKFARPVLYGVPDYKYIIDEKEAKKMNNVAELIEEKCRGVIPPNFSMDLESYFDKETSRTIILIDGFESYEAGELLIISPEDVLKIEIASGQIAGILYGKSRVISIFTNGNRKKNTIERVHSIKREIDGFYTARVFYSPNPNQDELDNKIAVRNTLYWNPYIHPDKTGSASVTYYNTKVETKVKVALEGITGSGIPVVKNVFYDIKK